MTFWHLFGTKPKVKRVLLLPEPRPGPSAEPKMICHPKAGNTPYIPLSAGPAGLARGRSSDDCIQPVDSRSWGADPSSKCTCMCCQRWTPLLRVRYPDAPDVDGWTSAPGDISIENNGGYKLRWLTPRTSGVATLGEYSRTAMVFSCVLRFSFCSWVRMTKVGWTWTGRLCERPLEALSRRFWQYLMFSGVQRSHLSSQKPGSARYSQQTASLAGMWSGLVDQ